MRIIPALLLTAVAISAVAAPPTWMNICESNPTQAYCDQVGKAAFNARGAGVQGVKLGTIAGVSWRPKGSVIGYAPAIPAAGIPARTRTAPEKSHYFIIDDGGSLFLRRAREIAPQ